MLPVSQPRREEGTDGRNGSLLHAHNGGQVLNSRLTAHRLKMGHILCALGEELDPGRGSIELKAE